MPQEYIDDARETWEVLSDEQRQNNIKFCNAKNEYQAWLAHASIIWLNEIGEQHRKHFFHFPSIGYLEILWLSHRYELRWLDEYEVVEVVLEK